MSRLTTLHHHWLLNSSKDGRMIYPTTTLREEVFHNYISDVFPWAAVKQKHHITKSFQALPTILEVLCPA